jgi:hypothetical protein
LVDAEQHVGEHDPSPCRRPDQQQRHRQADEPAGHEDGFAAEMDGKVVGEGEDPVVQGLPQGPGELFGLVGADQVGAGDGVDHQRPTAEQGSRR